MGEGGKRVEEDSQAAADGDSMVGVPAQEGPEATGNGVAALDGGFEAVACVGRVHSGHVFRWGDGGAEGGYLDG